MDEWNRITDLRGVGVGGLEEISQRTCLHICIAHGHRQPCGEGGRRGWMEGDNGREMGDICNNVHNNKKMCIAHRNLQQSCGEKQRGGCSPELGLAKCLVLISCFFCYCSNVYCSDSCYFKPFEKPRFQPSIFGDMKERHVKSKYKACTQSWRGKRRGQ